MLHNMNLGIKLLNPDHLMLVLIQKKPGKTHPTSFLLIFIAGKNVCVRVHVLSSVPPAVLCCPWTETDAPEDPPGAVQV